MSTWKPWLSCVRIRISPSLLENACFSRFDYKRLFTLGAADIIQTRLISRGWHYRMQKKSLIWPRLGDIGLAPHCPLGTHCTGSLPTSRTLSCQNAFIQEQSQGIHYNQSNDLTDYLVDPSVFHYTDGYVDIPQKPGLGIEINEEVVIERAKVGHRWRNPLWQHADGSIAEW